jgi:hypothetical protein
MNCTGTVYLGTVYGLVGSDATSIYKPVAPMVQITLGSYYSGGACRPSTYSGNFLSSQLVGAIPGKATPPFSLQ